MQSFLAKCAAVGIVAGGFAATGDLGRLADRGQRLLEARTVPHEPLAQAPVEPPPAPENKGDAALFAKEPHPLFEKPLPAQPFAPGVDPGPEASGSPAATSASPAAAANPAAALFSASDPIAVLGRPVAVPAPPSSSPEAIDVRHLVAGQRVLVWLRKPGVAAAGRSIDLLALDIIDPGTAAALEYRHLAEHHTSTAAVQAVVHAAPRRIVIGPADAGRITKGTALRVAPVRGVHGTGPVETLGTVLAIDLQGP